MTRKILLPLVIVLFLALIGWAGFAKAKYASPATQTWEYKVLYLTQPGEPRETDEMNKLGAEGWELVAVDNSHQYFKRAK